MIPKKGRRQANKSYKFCSNSSNNKNETKKEIIPNHSSVPINISKTRFPIIEECCNELQYRVVESSSKALIFWCDAGGSFEFISSLSQFQFCNHFPGTWSLARKVDLARNIGRLSKILPVTYNFHPKSFIIPSQYSELKSFMIEKQNEVLKKAKKKINIISSKSSNQSDSKSESEKIETKSCLSEEKVTFIIKPDKGSFGRGIILIQDPSEISDYYSTAIAQQYIEPYLIDGLKFDLRIYALVVSIDPLRIYLHKEGLARFCTEKYVKPSDGNLELSFAHLTNYALNKNNPNFQQPKDDDGLDKSCHKRSMNAVLKQIEEELFEKKKCSKECSMKNEDVDGKEFYCSEGNNTEKSDEKYDFNDESILMKGIEDIIRLTVISVQPYIASCYKTAIPVDDGKSRCFEILGFDIMIDNEGKPWLLEVNWSPSFADESPFDVTLKKSVIKGALEIVNVPSNFKKCVNARRKSIASRKPSHPLWSMEEELEISKKTNYKLIYPLSPNDERYAETEMALFESKNAFQPLNNNIKNENNNIDMKENGKSKSYVDFNLSKNNISKQARSGNQESPRNFLSRRGNFNIAPIVQKPIQAKIIPPVSRSNANAAPRQQHNLRLNIKNNISISQPLFPVQTVNCDDNSDSSAYYNSKSPFDATLFNQPQIRNIPKRNKSPRRFTISTSKTDPDEIQYIPSLSLSTNPNNNDFENKDEQIMKAQQNPPSHAIGLLNLTGEADDSKEINIQKSSAQNKSIFKSTDSVSSSEVNDSPSLEASQQTLQKAAKLTIPFVSKPSTQQPAIFKSNYIPPRQTLIC